MSGERRARGGAMVGRSAGSGELSGRERWRCWRWRGGGWVVGVILMLHLLLPGSARAAPVAGHTTIELEQRLLHGLELIAQGRLSRALAEVETIVREQPDFRLAQLVYGDLLSSRINGVREFGNRDLADDPARLQVAQLLDEAVTRLKFKGNHPPPNAIPGLLVNLARSDGQVIVVDVDLHRLYLFANQSGVPRLQVDYYVSIGKLGAGKERQGDKKTPLGLYFTTGYTPDEKLPDFYGAGALPLNYPNEWDKLQKKSGYGIWLHGNPSDTYSRPPNSSDGCVVLANPDFVTLNQLPANTPVVIGQRIKWLTVEEWRNQREQFLQLVNSWRQAWDSKDRSQLELFYAPEFQNGGGGYASWGKGLEGTLFATPGWERAPEDFGIYGYPAADSMMVVNYPLPADVQPAAPPRFRKQYWRLGESGWRILFDDISSGFEINGSRLGTVRRDRGGWG